MSDSKKKLELELSIPEKVEKRQKGYYFSSELHDFVSEEAKKRQISDNVVLAAMIEFYRDHRNRS